MKNRTVPVSTVSTLMKGLVFPLMMVGIILISACARDQAGPDITITAMKYYAPEVLTPKLGDYVGYEITITNIGNATFRGPFKVRAWLNGDVLRWEGYGETPVLAPGETYTGKQYAYTRFTKTGNNYIKLKVDADNEVVESREDNNETTIVVDISRWDDSEE